LDLLDLRRTAHSTSLVASSWLEAEAEVEAEAEAEEEVEAEAVLIMPNAVPCSISCGSYETWWMGNKCTK
jgi:hypothetical protein